MTVRLRETTMAWVDGVRVGVGSVTTDAYVDAAGNAQRGWVAALVLPEATGVFVGAGATIDIAGRTWQVVRIDKEGDALGVVVLESADA